MSDPPPSTQPAQEPPLFHQQDGQRIKTFVEAGGILNRPRLIRNLKKHDAVICSDPKNAQVILVDEDSWQGKEFIREWGKDQNKVVLSYAWVAKCLSTGRPLLAEDNWGGCLTNDDGLPILRPTSVGDDGIAISDSLPTPRETPAEIALASVPAPQKRKMSGIAANHLPPPINTAPPTVTEASGVKSPTPRLLPQRQGVRQPQPQPQLQPAPLLSPSVADPMSMFAQHHQAPSMPFPMPNGAMPPFSMPMNMMSFPPQMLAMLAQQATGVSSPIASQPPPMIPQIQENFNTALMDIMKMYGAVPGGMSMNPWSTLPGSIPPQVSQSFLQSTGGSSGSGTTVRDGSSVASGSRRDTESPNLLVPFPPPRSPPVLPASTKRKRKTDPGYDSSGESEAVSDEEEEAEPSLSSLTRKKKKVEQRRKRKEKEERRGSKSGLQYTAPARNPHESPSQGLKASTSDKIFAAEDGKPMQFFVQVDLKGRLEVTRAIKKHGGALTSEITTADYAVLYSHSTTFKALLTNATTSKTPAVTSHFVLDASSQGGIPDNLKNYLFDTKQNINRKKLDDPVEAEKKRLAKNAKQAERAAAKRAADYIYVARPGTPEYPPPSPGPSNRIKKGTSTTPKPISARDASDKASKGKEKEKATPGVKKPILGAAISDSVKKPTSKKTKEKAVYFPRDRTPPLPTQAEKWAQGYLYNREEKIFVEQYLPVLFKREPEMSQTAVSKVLHRKLPHHSVASWSAFLTNTFRAQYAEARKRGGIAHRKEKNLWEEEQKIKLKEKQTREEERVWEQKDKEEERGWLAADVREVEKELVGDGETESSSPSHAPMEVDEPTELTESAMAETGKEVHVSKLTQDEEHDLNTVLQFFLNGGDDGKESEEQVWAKLGQQAQPKSAASWGAFYDKHPDEVTDRYGKLLEELNRG